MDANVECAKANLLAIVNQLESCEFTCEGGSLKSNVMFAELKQIAEDRHAVAACLVNMWYGMGINRSISYITPDDIGRPIDGNQVVKVTIEFVPMSECQREPINA